MVNIVQFIWSCIWKSCKFPASKNINVGNPAKVAQSPVPWRVSLSVLALGVISLTIGAILTIAALNEVGRAMIYLPLGSMFGMGTQAYTSYRQGSRDNTPPPSNNGS